MLNVMKKKQERKAHVFNVTNSYSTKNSDFTKKITDFHENLRSVFYMK